MKLHILYRFVAGPYGGGNQFLKALRDELRRRSAYAENITKADCIIINPNPASISYLLRKLPHLTRQSPRPKILVRLDGPISLVRGKDTYFDHLLAKFIKLYANGLVFQSQWSCAHNQKLFGTSAPRQTVIYNAPDSAIFFPTPHPLTAPKIRLIATSWSTNPRKGFALYKYLDTHLDFSQYKMTFVGNSPVSFNNIVVVPPQVSSELANTLRQHDIYITASENDPCSNALLEALACGLPAIARNSGGHPELLQSGGVLFKDEADILPAINKVTSNRDAYRQKIPQYMIHHIAQSYLDFARTLGSQHPKPPSFRQRSSLHLRYYTYQAFKMFKKS